MAKPKLALIPAAQGTSLYSVLPSSGVGDFDFTRSGSATRINAQGLIETVASGVSRLNYPMIDGVVKGCPHHILEPQRTQLVQYSEDFSQGYWTRNGSSVTSGFLSPDGTLNASKLSEDNTNAIHRIYQTATVSASPNATISIYVKYNQRKFVLIRVADSSVGRWYDIENGVLGSTYTGTPNDSSIESVGNGWYRISISHTVSNQARLELWVSDTESTSAYQGDTNKGVYIFGAQLEQGSYPTSYIPNYGTAAGVTRSAETAIGSGDASTFNDSEGVLMIEANALEENAQTKRITLSDGTSSNRLSIYLTDAIGVVGVSSGGLVLNNGFGNYDTTIFNKIALKYKQNDFALYINGYEILTSINGNSPIGLNQLRFNDGYSGSGAAFYGNTKQIQYFDTALTDNELETLTSWVSFTDMAEGQLYTIE